MRPLLPWLLWSWLCLALAGALYYAPPGEQFIGQSSRILFAHVPVAWAAFAAFLAAGYWSVRYLLGGRRRRHDAAAASAVELGLLFGLLATATGALWARIEWGVYWNWDPRQTSIVLVLLFYGAYVALRSAIEDGETRRRLAATYATFGLVVAPFFFFIVPRLTFSLHPEPIVNVTGQVEMDARMLQVLLATGAAFLALFFWLHHLRCRVFLLAERQSEVDSR